MVHVEAQAEQTFMIYMVVEVIWHDEVQVYVVDEQYKILHILHELIHGVGIVYERMAEIQIAVEQQNYIVEMLLLKVERMITILQHENNVMTAIPMTETAVVLHVYTRHQYVTILM